MKWLTEAGWLFHPLHIVNVYFTAPESSHCMAALEVLVMTTSSADTDHKVVNVTALPFQCLLYAQTIVACPNVYSTGHYPSGHTTQR